MTLCFLIRKHLNVEDQDRNLRPRWPIIAAGIQAMPLIASLIKAYAKNRIVERLKFYCQPKLLIIDEIGHIPIDRHGAPLFFQLISRRYEGGADPDLEPQLLPLERGIRRSGDRYGHLDRILNHSTTVNIKGNSYRLKENIEAGLIREPEVEENQ